MNKQLKLENLRTTPREVEFSHEESDRINQRVVTNLDHSTTDLTGYDRIAARHLFSEFRHLEEIAVFAAMTGGGIEGQLEDEFVHRESFESLAIHYGGLVEPCDEISNLVQFLKQQQGDMSLALLNVVGESWLETVFNQVNSWKILGDIFDIIESDEARHVHDALELAMPPVEESEENIRRLEYMLEKIMTAPQFIIPIAHFAGPKRASELGLAVCDAHEKACKHLGVVANTKQMRLICRTQKFLSLNEPFPTEMTTWEENKMNIWDHAVPVTESKIISISTTNPVKLQAKIASVLGKCLSRNPKLKTVLRRNQLFSIKKMVIGQRFLYDESQVSTVFLHGADHLSYKELIKQTHSKVRKIRSKVYGSIPQFGELSVLLPPSRCPIVVNYCGDADYPTGPLSDIEGIPLILMIGKPFRDQQDNWKTTLTLTGDHRVIDAQHGGWIMKSLQSI